MSGPGEVIGGVAEGALLSRAVEPGHGEGGNGGDTLEAACLNCGTALIGNHCHTCGQAAHVHKTLGAFFHDLLHGVFHFEGKIWRTLPLLAWKPGQLTREYIDGRRASYVSPIALFLFVVFLTFALFNLASGPIHFNQNSDPAALAKAEAKAIKQIADLKSQLAAAQAAGEQTAAIEGQLVGAEAALNGIRTSKKGGPIQVSGDSDAASGPEWARGINDAWDDAAKNPDLAIYKVQSSAYKYSWLLIPLSVPFVWLLFPFSRKFHLYDHTVFVTYSLSFMLIVLAAITAINVWTSFGALIALLMFYVPFHMHRQLRGTYGLSRAGALWRTALLSGFAIIALMLFAMAVLGLSMG
ncbi:DUF3667 domain-containing protein [Novosphingobium sp.]|uniref:DUF3667 domain-containing protein n=1 Tax=Novosphingobium sp. TaxID=1874826 RepID=UPI00286B6FFF|nr:DUF3667 domain-containing protein [Novosphingobium sp.]